MLSRAKKILDLIEHELGKRDRAIEVDDTITEVKLIIRFDQRTGEPGRISYTPTSEYSLPRGRG